MPSFLRLRGGGFLRTAALMLWKRRIGRDEPVVMAGWKRMLHGACNLPFLEPTHHGVVLPAFSACVFSWGDHLRLLFHRISIGAERIIQQCRKNVNRLDNSVAFDVQGVYISCVKIPQQEI